MVCLHGHHARHLPSLWPAPWVDDVARQQQIGASLACPCAIAPRFVQTSRSFDDGDVG
ncbi:MAG: DUF3565 domain-containing protein [Ilumatobacteraceae bacterium]